MEKIWLKSYPKGVPAEIDVNQFRSLKEIIEISCKKYADRPAFTNMGVSLSYDDIERQSRAFGAYLQNDLGLQKGDRVAIMMPNLLQYPVALFGALRAGVTVVNVNPLYTARELRHQLTDSGAKAIVILENFAHTLEKVIADTHVEHVVTTQIGDMFPFPKRPIVNFVVKRVKKMVPGWRIPGHVPLRVALAKGAQGQLEDRDIGHDDIAFLQYTGGTTGVAKGAMLTHRNMVANLLQASVWLAEVIEEGKERIVTALPLYHIFSLTVNAMVFFEVGGENMLITNPRDFPAFIKELKDSKFTAITGVNTLFNALMNTPGFDDIDFSRMKLSVGGGMAVQQAVADRWKQKTGVTLIEGYGLTETSPIANINPLDLEAYNHSIGLPVPSCEESIRDDDLNELPVGEVGELCIRGPQVMKGYWNRPEETDAAITQDGWLRTGDMAKFDENGYVFIVDRKKDMILVSGFNVYPNEVEDIAASHPGVAEVAAVGWPDPNAGEIVKLFVVKKDPNLTEKALIDHCRKELTAYKVPKQVEFRDELPKTNVGKILRRELRKEADQAANG